MVGWHHWLNGHVFEQTQGGSKGQGSLACCSPRGLKELDTTQQLNNNNNQNRVARFNPRSSNDRTGLFSHQTGLCPLHYTDVKQVLFHKLM